MRVFLNLLILSISLSVFAGPGSGGGGGTGIQFKRHQCVMLLDVLTIHPEYENRMDKIMGRDCADFPKRVNPYPEFEEFRPEDQKAVEFAIKVLNRNLLELTQNSDIEHRAAFAFILNVRKMLETTSFLRTGHEFKFLSSYYVPKTLEHARAKMGTVALHLPRYGVLISSPAWDMLDVETQGMFLIHETVRQFQEEPSNWGLKDQALETMVALLFEPSLQVEPFVRQMLTAPRLIRRYAVTGQNLNGDLKSYIDSSTGLVRDINLNEDISSASDPALKLVLGLAVELDSLVANSQKKNANESFMTVTKDEKAALIQQLVRDGVLMKNTKWVEKND